MDAREKALAEFVAGLKPDELKLIETFLKLRSDFLDAQRGLTPWPQKN